MSASIAEVLTTFGTFPYLQVQFLLGRQGPAQCLNMTDDPMKIHLIPRNGDKPIVSPLLFSLPCTHKTQWLHCKSTVTNDAVALDVHHIKFPGISHPTVIATGPFLQQLQPCFAESLP